MGSLSESKFDELVYNREFIYRENMHTKLGEVTEKLLKIYPKCSIIQNENNIKKNPSVQDFILVTFVEKYTGLPMDSISEISDDSKLFSCNQFVFSVPFYDKNSENKLSLSNQQKKRTILHTKQEFPSTQVRIEVTHSEEHILSSIETALEDLVKKTSQLENSAVACHEAFTARNVNVFQNSGKTLQLVLGGAVSPTVHQGPLEIAKTFLNESVKIEMMKYFKKLEKKEVSERSKEWYLFNKLRTAVLRFLFICEMSLELNEKIVEQQDDQRSYHEQLVQDFDKLQ